jgi:phosphoglycolate phosphatase/putative hydrolase of the HAD superfamily
MLLRLVRVHVFRPLRGWKVARVIRAYRQAQEELRDSASHDAARRQTTMTSDRTGVPIEEVERITMRWLHQEPLVVLARFRRADLVETLDELRANGIRLGIVSDYPADDKLTALGVRQFFDVVVSAQDPDVGAFKPNPRGLQHCLARLGVRAEHALYVGDRPETDAVAARSSEVGCVIIGSSRPPVVAADHVAITAFRELVTECAAS